MSALLRVVHVLWLRQLRGYWRSRIRLAGSLAHPMLYLMSLGAGFGPIFKRAGEGNYLQFLSPGIVAMSILFAAVFSGTDLLWERRFGVLKEAFVAPLPSGVFIIGRALGSSSVALIQGTIVAVLCVIAGYRFVGLSLLPAALLVMMLISMLFASMGLLIGCSMSDHSGFQLVMNLAILPMSFLSGAFYPLRTLPRALHILARLDPLSYGVDALRIALAGGSTADLAMDIGILAALTMVMVMSASFAFGKLRL